MSAASNKSHQERAAALSPDDRREIGAQLRSIYAYIDQYPIPDRHVDLLLELRHRERNRRKTGAS